MMPPDPKDDLANDWLNGLLAKLRFEQDYYIYPGSSEPLLDKDGKNIGISIKRPDVRLYSTGVTKLYEMVVEGKELPDVEYTEAEEKAFDDNMRAKYPDVFKGESDDDEVAE